MTKNRLNLRKVAAIAACLAVVTSAVAQDYIGTYSGTLTITPTIYLVGDPNNVNTEIPNQKLAVSVNYFGFVPNIPLYKDGETISIGITNVAFESNGNFSAPERNYETGMTFTDISGNVSGSTVNVTFRILDTETGGTRLDATFSYTGTKQNVQFPSPQNFQMSLHYIRLDELGICAGEFVSGPYFCTTFHWNEPDLSETESQLVGYRIYYYFTEEELTEIPFSEGQMITQTNTTDFTIGDGFPGYTWVTAVYADPDGESAPSNVDFLAGLPLSINKNEMKTHSIVYNRQMQTIDITGIDNIASINVFGIDGKFITASELNNIDVKYLTKGIYIIKVTTATGKMISDKLIIE
jgi:hypothetical protein